MRSCGNCSKAVSRYVNTTRRSWLSQTAPRCWCRTQGCGPYLCSLADAPGALLLFNRSAVGPAMCFFAYAVCVMQPGRAYCTPPPSCMLVCLGVRACVCVCVCVVASCIHCIIASCMKLAAHHAVRDGLWRCCPCQRCDRQTSCCVQAACAMRLNKPVAATNAGGP